MPNPLQQLVDQYFDFYFQVNPTTATQTGFHQYDSQLEDFSRAGVESQVAGLERFHKQFSAIQRAALPEESAGDLDVLTSSINSGLLELQTIQSWKKGTRSLHIGRCQQRFCDYESQLRAAGGAPVLQ